MDDDLPDILAPGSDDLPDILAPGSAYFNQFARSVRDREAKAARLRAHSCPRDVLISAQQLRKYFGDDDTLAMVEEALIEEMRRREMAEE